MNEWNNKAVGEIVAEDYKYASVFQKYGLDFCCNGHLDLEEACKIKDISYDDVQQKLSDVKSENRLETLDFNSWEIDLLADHIQKKHHKYVEEKIPLINAYLEKLCQVHGGRHPELFKIAELFKVSGGELTTHMKKEELILFPFVKNMIKAKQQNTEVPAPIFGSVANPIEAMHEDHDNEGNRFKQISELSNGYTPPGDGCTTYAVTYAELKAFEEDLHLHIHLENNVLFPKAIALEKEFLEK